MSEHRTAIGSAPTADLLYSDIDQAIRVHRGNHRQHRSRIMPGRRGRRVLRAGRGVKTVPRMVPLTKIDSNLDVQTGNRNPLFAEGISEATQVMSQEFPRNVVVGLDGCDDPYILPGDLDDHLAERLWVQPELYMAALAPPT